MKVDEAVKIIEEALSAQVAPLAERDPDSPLAREVVAALRDRLVLAETALDRTDGVKIQRWEPTVPQLFLVIRNRLTREELAEWDRLARVISQTMLDAVRQDEPGV